MTPRERYIAALLFEDVDKIPFSPGGPRRSTLARWRAEGLAEGENYMDAVQRALGFELPQAAPLPGFHVDFRMRPQFEEKVLEHAGGHYIVQDWMGAITEISDEYDYTYIRNAIDFVTRKWHRFPVQTREDFEAMKRRYDPADPGRFPEGASAMRGALAAREQLLMIGFNGPFWQLREWCGFEGLCMFMADDPEFVLEMADFWRGFVRALLERVFEYVIPDAILVNEDMAYKAHSMISPAMTRKFLMPCYAAWLPYAKARGVPIRMIDSDGCVDVLLPLWIEAGFNVATPMEVAAHNDIVEHRRLYGRSMGYTGGIDKRLIARGGERIRAEIARVEPVIRGGGYIPGCDHGVPHDISWTAFLEYCELLAKVTRWK